MPAESDVWMGGLYDLLVRGGCFELGCPMLMHGEPQQEGRQARLVISHAGNVRIEVTAEIARGISRIETLGLTPKLVQQLQAAHARGVRGPQIEVEQADGDVG